MLSEVFNFIPKLFIYSIINRSCSGFLFCSCSSHAYWLCYFYLIINQGEFRHEETDRDTRIISLVYFIIFIIFVTKPNLCLHNTYCWVEFEDPAIDFQIGY
ncbi:hypothetical protein RND81_09G149600 [Saponaria officinalis]|uniref:Uncharacterized protein n=1 Tax=Saponaria officinalis TaxID=3572 RepID=A0AAW1IMX6_SAPOF